MLIQSYQKFISDKKHNAFSIILRFVVVSGHDTMMHYYHRILETKQYNVDFQEQDILLIKSFK